MIKRFARWILREELKRIDEMQENQLTKLKNLYVSNLNNLKEQHNKEIELFIGSRK